MIDDHNPGLTTSQSASLVRKDRLKRGSHHMEPKAPLTGGAEAPTAKSGFFTTSGRTATDAVDHTMRHDAVALEGAIWFCSGGQHWGRERHMALLAAIDVQGSISAAARTVGLSYKAAWDAVDAMNNLAGEALVLRTTGGARGGGACLTPRAHQLLRLYQTLQREHARFMARLNAISAAHADPDRDLEWMRHMMTQVSIRNRLAGTVAAVHKHGVRADVTLALGNTQSIVATITQDSARALGLVPGKRALALIKASNVTIAPVGRKHTSVHKNRLSGHIRRIQHDAAHTEVHLALHGAHTEDYTMAATLTHAGFDKLNLEQGDPALVVFAPTQVMVGVVD